MNKSSGPCISLSTLLTVLFVGLKLCDKINWSWWWVLAPLWGPFAVVFVVMGALGTIAVILKVIARIITKEG